MKNMMFNIFMWPLLQVIVVIWGITKFLKFDNGKIIFHDKVDVVCFIGLGVALSISVYRLISGLLRERDHDN